MQARFAVAPWALIALVSFALLGSPGAAAARDGQVFSLTGSALVNGRPVSPGMDVNDGDSIRTFRNSSVKLLMKDQSLIDIDESTEFEITGYGYDAQRPEESESTFSLLKGAFRYVSGLIAKRKPEAVAVNMGSATMGIRGSFIDRIAFDGGAVIEVDAAAGVATIFPGDGSQIVVAANNSLSYNLQSGATQIIPTTLPSPIARAATQASKDPGRTDQATQDLTPVERVVTGAALLANQEHYGVQDTEDRRQVFDGLLTPENVAVATFVLGLIDRSNADAFRRRARERFPDQADDIDSAADATDEFVGDDTGAGEEGEEAPPPLPTPDDDAGATGDVVDATKENPSIVGSPTRSQGSSSGN